MSGAPLRSFDTRPAALDVKRLRREFPVFEAHPDLVFLDSGGSPGDGAGWTLLAFDPTWRLEVRGGVLWSIEGAEAVSVPGDPVEALAHLWPPRFEYEWSAELSGENRWLMPPCVSGLAGFLSYDFKDYLERYPRRARRESQVPDLSLGFYDVVWAWSPSGIGVVVSSGLPERDILARGERAESRLRQQWERLLGAGRPMLAMNPRATLRHLLDQRRPLYEEVAAVVVRTDGLTPEEVATQVLAELR